MLALNFHAVLAFWKTGWRAGSGLGIGAIATAGDVVFFIKSGRRNVWVEGLECWKGGGREEGEGIYVGETCWGVVVSSVGDCR